jgi:ubiquinol-cytochrome c reductase cytochrome b subunit
MDETKKFSLLKTELGDFYDFLSGLTDGDGCFTVSQVTETRWSFTFKIVQSTYNVRLLVYVQKKLDCGVLWIDGVNKPLCFEGPDRVTFRVQRQDLIRDLIVPLFENYPLLTQKYYDFIFFRKAFETYVDKSLSSLEKSQRILELKKKHSEEIIKESPAFLKLKFPFDLLQQRRFWLVGFTEAEGSFHLYKDGKSFRFCFEISQKLDHSLMRMIAQIFKMSLSIQPNVIRIKARSSESLKFVIPFFKNNLKGMKAVEFKLWLAAYRKYKASDFLELFLVQKRLRQLRLIRFAHPLCFGHPRYRESFSKDKRPTVLKRSEKVC